MSQLGDFYENRIAGERMLLLRGEAIVARAERGLSAAGAL